MSRRNSLLRRSVALTATAALAVTGAPGRAEANAPAGAGQAPVAAPDKALGGNWKSSSDVVVTGAGDADGYHLYIAREKNAFGWQTLATLRSESIDVGPWGGSVCVTGSGKYAVAVFAPKKAANDPNLMMAGALAAVVDTSTGAATTVATGLQFSYFNPSCGPDDRVLLTRATGDDTQAGRRTDLLTVDAAAGRVVRTRHIDAQLTTPAPAPDGDYGVVGGQLVKVAADSGAFTKLGKPHGLPFGVRATAGGAIDIVSVSGADAAVAERFQDGRFTTTATGPKTKLQLFGLRGGRNALVGAVNRRGAAPDDLASVAADDQVETISRAGHLLVREVRSRQTAESVARPLVAADPSLAGQVQLKLRAVAGKADSAVTVNTTAAPTLDVDLAALSPVQTVTTKLAAQLGESPCVIPRNDPTIQPQQPSPDMVEWAVDLAVHGQLNVVRPDYYLKSTMPSYSPQGMFAPASLYGGGTVPAQVELAILAQETNLSQASWHAVPGDTGNPLISSYYGSYDPNVIDYTKVDCGYGIGQVTTGMRSDDDVYSPDEQIAIAVDYAANIAASINILVDKWNQLHTEPSGYTDTINNDDPKYVENWFLALWAYNSGLHGYATRNTESGANGYFGLGWLNNPANPDYTPARAGFMRHTTADAETPNKWSYPERIMGWAETPQKKDGNPTYVEPTYGTAADYYYRVSDLSNHYGLAIPGLWTFCSASFGCSQAANGCPAVNSSCWWHGHADFADCSTRCATEQLAYPSTKAEPGVQRVYDRDCGDFDVTKVPNRAGGRNYNMIYTLNDTGQYNLYCSIPSGPLSGKFALRGGDPAGGDGAPYAWYDTHQLGAGYKGHIWFTHGASGSTLAKHKMVGAWNPELDLTPGQVSIYEILAHLPSHGATWQAADYQIWSGSGPNIGSWESCTVPQDEAGTAKGSDHWVSLGSHTLGVGGMVQLSNEGASSTDDVGYDAMVFVPQDAPGSRSCGDDM
jgi:hypothetical protein